MKFFTEKVGGFPLWAWMAVGLVGVLVFSSLTKGSKKQAADQGVQPVSYIGVQPAVPEAQAPKPAKSITQWASSIGGSQWPTGPYNYYPAQTQTAAFWGPSPKSETDKYPGGLPPGFGSMYSLISPGMTTPTVGTPVTLQEWANRFGIVPASFQSMNPQYNLGSTVPTGRMLRIS